MPFKKALSQYIRCVAKRIVPAAPIREESIHRASYYISTGEADRTYLLHVPQEKLEEAKGTINQFKKLKNLLTQIIK